MRRSFEGGAAKAVHATHWAPTERATAVEPDGQKCVRLRERSAALQQQGRRGFEVQCRAYQQLEPPFRGADLYRAAERAPGPLITSVMLTGARSTSRVRCAQQLPAAAEAILLFDLANTRRLDPDQPDCKRSAELVIYNE